MNYDVIFFSISVCLCADSHAGSGQSAPRQHDGQLHQHLPDGGHTRTLEGEEVKKGSREYEHKPRAAFSTEP